MGRQTKLKIAVNGDINNAVNRPVVHDDSPEMLGSLGDKFYFRMPMGWKVESTISTPPMGTARIYNRGSRLQGGYRGALLLTADIAVFMCHTYDGWCLALVKDGRAVIIPESKDGFFGSVNCSNDGMTVINDLRQYFKYNTIDWESLETEYLSYKWDDIKLDINNLLLVGGVA